MSYRCSKCYAEINIKKPGTWLVCPNCRTLLKIEGENGA